jgi:hypothetical protein
MSECCYSSGRGSRPLVLVLLEVSIGLVVILGAEVSVFDGSSSDSPI